jgi:hypothetical protein
MNSYELSRKFWDFAFDNPEKIKPIHSAIYFFAIEHCNRLGWKEKFGLPSQMVMEAIGVKNWRTYSQGLNELIDFGFIKLLEKSTNQYSSNIIAIVNFTKADTKALDKALQKHGTKQGQSIVSIDKQETKKQETIYLVPFQERVNSFLNWFNLEFLKHEKPQAKFRTLNNQTESNLKKLLDKYTTEEWSYAFLNMVKSEWVIESKNATPDHFLRPANFEKYVNQPKQEQETFKAAWQ